MTIRFISDLHLSPARPDITALFLDFLETDGRASTALYILGDLFDAWLGDDDDSAFATQIRTALKALTNAGVPVFFMAGNRDFLIGERFAEATGIGLLTDGAVINLYGQRTLLMHGDTLCTLDHSYQRFRRIIQSGPMTFFLRHLPLAWRMHIAAKLRANSATQNRPDAASLERMDVTTAAVEQAMADAKVDLLIHGHTHQPAVHELKLSNGQPAKRIVLGDWYEQGSVLEVSRERQRLLTRKLPTEQLNDA